MKELIHRLFPFAKPQVHRVLVPRVSARCLKVSRPTGEKPPKIVLVESELAIAPAIKRLNMKAVTFESLPVFLSSCHFLSPRINAVPIESIDCATVKVGHELIIPSIFSCANPWRINILRADGFKLKHAVVQPLSFDNFEGHGLTLISTGVTPTVFSGVDRANGIINAQVNQIDPNEIVVNRGVVQYYEGHLDEGTTVKIESVLQIPHCEILEASQLLATLIKFEKFSSTTIKARIHIVNIKIVSVIQNWRDFAPLVALKIFNHTNAFLPPTLCERYGISWRFFNENGDECSAFNIPRKIIWFKLSDESLNRGRLAKRVTAGISLLVVPASWKCLNLTSPCFVFQEQELLAVDRWQGYLIHVDQKTEDFPRFKTARGVEITCNWISFGRHAIPLHHFDPNRLRWGIANIHAGEPRMSWQNKPIEIEESRFAATSSEALWVHIPEATYIDSIHAGFKPRKLRRKRGIFPIALREFCDAEELRKNGAIFYLWIWDSKREHKVAALEIKTKTWHCKISGCSFVSQDLHNAESHFRKTHSPHGYRVLPYGEAQKNGLYGQQFPQIIYQCGYNPQHFVNATSFADNPTSTIIDHIQRECVDARRQAHGGYFQIRFRVVEDAEEIRSVHISNLPIWVECLYCHNFYKKPESGLNEEIFAHLLQSHRNEILEWK
ncbi:MAG: hypothetical protein ONB46_05515 [candidate division KSB1 bacterium]|nr:hypothetical protein [candidate division KSB1 bacterium]MDZ7365436.1 hypothetical protein [candidate division KSB1 bacterium]MDZ7403517.1 hypothetical protein [candidate division KSB1 bacterium]